MAKSNQKKGIYLDYAASAKANPGAIHAVGLAKKVQLEKARAVLADFFAARPEEIIFCSGGTESNNLVLQGIVWYFKKINPKQKPHLIISNIEHPAVLDTAQLLADRKLAEITLIPVEENGLIDPKKIKKAIKKNTVLISVMYANNEIGTIQPLTEIIKEIRYYRKINQTNLPYFHTDAVQAINYLDLNVQKLGVDFLSASGAKVETASSIGFLYKRKNVPLEKIMGGGGQEFNFRPGTENSEEVLKLVQALKRLSLGKNKEVQRLLTLRNYFLKKVIKLMPVGKIILNGDLEKRLPNNLNLTFGKIPSDLLVLELSARNIFVSSKSACQSSKEGISHVLQAIRPKLNSKIGGVRFSFGPRTTQAELDFVFLSLKQILKKLEKWYN